MTPQDKNQQRDRANEILGARWVVVAPENPDRSGAGWTIWTRGLSPNARVAWQAQFPGTEAVFDHIVAAHNACVEAFALPDLPGVS